MMLALIVESAIRTLVLGIAVRVGLKVLRVGNVRAQLTIWSAVLLAALSMPFLMQWTTMTLPAPSAAFVWIAPPASTPVVVPHPVRPLPAEASGAVDWNAFLLWGYLWTAGLLILRLLVGVALTWRMFRVARPLRDAWVGDMNVRTSSAIKFPVTFGSTILLPEDYASWDTAKRQAVLSHERAHVQRGDFYVQLLAGVHRAIFWFSPLAWWLQGRLSELAELASDDTAIEDTADRLAYAEILLDLSRKQSNRELIGVGMARPKTIGRRMERILSETTTSASLGPLKHAVLLVAVAPLVAFSAGCSWRSQAQSAPAPSTALPQPDLTTSSLDSGRDDEAFAVITSGSRWVHGSDRDARRAQSQSEKIEGDYIWFERDLKFYYITEPRTVERAKEILRPQDELGRRQAELGEAQAKLGEEQARLGEEQSQVSIQVPDLTKALEALQARLAGSAGKQLRQHELGDIQASIGELQARFGDLQGRAGEAQARLGEQQAKLGEQQARLGAEQSRLGEQQSRLAAEAQAQLRSLLDEALRNGQARPVQ